MTLKWVRAETPRPLTGQDSYKDFLVCQDNSTPWTVAIIALGVGDGPYNCTNHLGPIVLYEDHQVPHQLNDIYRPLLVIDPLVTAPVISDGSTHTITTYQICSWNVGGSLINPQSNWYYRNLTALPSGEVVDNVGGRVGPTTLSAALHPLLHKLLTCWATGGRTSLNWEIEFYE